MPAPPSIHCLPIIEFIQSDTKITIWLISVLWMLSILVQNFLCLWHTPRLVGYNASNLSCHWQKRSSFYCIALFLYIFQCIDIFLIKINWKDLQNESTRTTCPFTIHPVGLTLPHFYGKMSSIKLKCIKQKKTIHIGKCKRSECAYNIDMNFIPHRVLLPKR